jgi:hypothetical protein
VPVAPRRHEVARLDDVVKPAHAMCLRSTETVSLRACPGVS